jgi:hypothetical protein
MADVPVPPSIPDQIKRLEAAAAKLNKASDELSKPVVDLNGVLKRLNVGVPAWFKFDGWFEEDTTEYSKSEIGYAKVSGEWGICLRQVSGFADDPTVEHEERWQFDDAPRRLRLEAIDHLGDLLNTLVTEADTTADQLLAKVESAKQVAAAAAAATTQRFDLRQRRR